MTYFILLIIIPLLAWFSGWLAQTLQLNFWLVFTPIILVGFVLFRYGSGFLKKR
ncbi:MAG TPA: hypothetical protein VJK26_00285 [Patescibacteria group bacterium]|nr:hypothetical protein [Patescibacteria group bacterium]